LPAVYHETYVVFNMESYETVHEVLELLKDWPQKILVRLILVGSQRTTILLAAHSINNLRTSVS